MQWGSLTLSAVVSWGGSKAPCEMGQGPSRPWGTVAAGDLQGRVPLQEVSPYYLSCNPGGGMGPESPGLRPQGQPHPSCLRPGSIPQQEVGLE